MTQEPFWTIFAAVMFANLLTVGFVWGMVQYTRLEREERAGDARVGVWSAILMPMLFLIAGLLIATDSTPEWLAFILQ